MRGSIVWLIVCVATASCGTDSTSSFNASAIHRSLDERNQQAALRCECEDVRGGQSRVECLRAEGGIRPAERECLLEVDARYGAAVSRFAECVLSAEELRTACLEDAGCDESAADSCDEDYDGAREACLADHPLPKRLSSEESLCLETEVDDELEADASAPSDEGAKPPRDAASMDARDGGTPDVRADAAMPAAGSSPTPSSKPVDPPATPTPTPAPTGECANALPVNPKISIPTVWQNGPAACDYLVRGSVGLSSSLQIEPGTVVHFSQDASFHIESGGQLTAVGAADARIRFIGVLDVSGYWNGMQFLAGSRESRIEYVDIRNAGQTGSGLGKYGRAIGGNGAVTFKHNRVSGSYLHGASFGETLIIREFESNVFEDNIGFGLTVGYNQVAKLDIASDYLGKDKPNGRPYILADWDSRHLETPSTWKKLGAPYLFSITLDIYARLVLEPGVQLVAAEGAAIEVSTGGSLTAIGTSDQPVVFTAERKAKGAWTGIVYYQSFSTSNLLQHVRLEYAGDGGRVGGHRAAIELISASRPSSLTISDSVISNSAGFPICYGNDLTTPTLTYERVQFVDTDSSQVAVCN